MKYYCNPINVNYHYQFNTTAETGKYSIGREAADPSMIYFKGKYYIFASVTLEVWVSEDMVSWESYRLPDNLPLYDYAPDVRIFGEYVYFSASKLNEACNFYRTKDIINGPYEEIPGSFPFWDPNLFIDEDGRVYFYWGSSNVMPIYGVELDAATMRPKTEPKGLIWGNPEEHGYERCGTDHNRPPVQEKVSKEHLDKILKVYGVSENMITDNIIKMIEGIAKNHPFLEGPWMDKFGEKYYLQYSAPATEENIYGDGVYVGDTPLGPFTLAENNPYSYHPGGFMTGAGHGSTMMDEKGNLWHASTMQISCNFPFERRVGIWRAGLDADGELFCNQRYGDWPVAVSESKDNPWENPPWYLLSYRKATESSSEQNGCSAVFAVDENAKTRWRAKSDDVKPWIKLDLGKKFNVHAIQINFADHELQLSPPGKIRKTGTRGRYIDDKKRVTRWILEGSVDGKSFWVIKNKEDAQTDLPHDFLVLEKGIEVRYLRLTILELPFGQAACISGLRVFGKGDGAKPAVPEYSVVRKGELDMEVCITGSTAGKGKNSPAATGYNILWGSAPEKLYHSYMIFGKTKQNIGALVKGKKYYVRVDAFNENGITEGRSTYI